MNLTLYVNNSEQNKLGKSLTSPLAMTGTLREECDILNPAIVITAENLTGYNYMYVPEFNRYYFITDIRSVRNGVWEVVGRVDVLESWKSNIKNLSCILARQESEYDMYLQDDSFRKESYTRVATLEFPNSFLSINKYILLVSGGGTQ